MDDDRNGWISECEYTRYGMYSYRYGRFDANNNECWDRSEFSSYTTLFGGTGTFDSVDFDSNGCINQAEYISYAYGGSIYRFNFPYSKEVAQQKQKEYGCRTSCLCCSNAPTFSSAALANSNQNLGIMEFQQVSK
jgi:hypothetical protein